MILGILLDSKMKAVPFFFKFYLRLYWIQSNTTVSFDKVLDSNGFVREERSNVPIYFFWWFPFLTDNMTMLILSFPLAFKYNIKVTDEKFARHVADVIQQNRVAPSDGILRSHPGSRRSPTNSLFLSTNGNESRAPLYRNNIVLKSP